MFNELSLIPILENFANVSDFIIAYSGGLDSTVLLHAITKIRPSFPNQQFKAIHINHGLSPNALDWENHCQRFCDQRALKLLRFSVDAKPKTGESPEDAARKARYAIFSKIVTHNFCLLTAHQQNDQAETVLLQLFRGAGVQGLSAMPLLKPFAKGFLIRPLLNFTRAELQAYAEKEGLIWVDDESNLKTNIDRNFIRHAILPVIKKRYPQIEVILSRVAKNANFASEITNELAVVDLDQIKKENHILSISKLMKLSEARRNNVLRYWLQTLELPLPNSHHLEKLYFEVLSAKPDANPILIWSSVEIRRYRDNLYAFKKADVVNLQLCIPINLTTCNGKFVVTLPNQIGEVVITIEKYPVNKKYFYCSMQSKLFFTGTIQHLQIAGDKKISIRFRQGGEKIQPHGRKETQELKKLLQTWGVPPWQRNQIPLLYIGDELAAVVGFCVAEKFNIETC